jgi:ferredoxin
MVTIRPIIEYDKEKCGDPSNCLKCIKICPYKVLAYRPLEIPEPGKPPKDWIVVSTCRVMCVYPSCKLCIEACPNEALNVSIPEF